MIRSQSSTTESSNAGVPSLDNGTSLSSLDNISASQLTAAVLPSIAAASPPLVFSGPTTTPIVGPAFLVKSEEPLVDCSISAVVTPPPIVVGPTAAAPTVDQERRPRPNLVAVIMSWLLPINYLSAWPIVATSYHVNIPATNNAAYHMIMVVLFVNNCSYHSLPPFHFTFSLTTNIYIYFFFD